MGLYGGPFVLRRSGCVHYSHSFQWGVRGLLRAGTTVLPMQAEHPSLFVQWVGEGAAGKDVVSLLPDNRGPGSCLWHNKGTSLRLVLCILVLVFLFFFLSIFSMP